MDVRDSSGGRLEAYEGARRPSLPFARDGQLGPRSRSQAGVHHQQ
jgi:hypothetical protein